MDAILAALGLKKGTVIAGLCGGIASYRFFKDLDSEGRTLAVFSGIALAIFCGPAIGKHWNLALETEIGLTFVLGIAGISLLSAVVKALPALIEAAKSKYLG